MTIFNSLSIRRRSLAQILTEFAAVYLYIWVIQKQFPLYVHAPFLWFFCVGFPIVCIASEQREFPEFSLDAKNWSRSLREILWFTLLGSIVLLGIGEKWNVRSYDGQTLSRVAEYVFWAFLQQVGLQMFLTRRMMRVIPNRWGVSAACAFLFAMIHWPNPPLVVLTFVAGFFWSWSFQRTPNLYVLAASHGWLAVLALYTIPQAWMHQLRVGPDYFTYHP